MRANMAHTAEPAMIVSETEFYPSLYEQSNIKTWALIKDDAIYNRYAEMSKRWEISFTGKEKERYEQGGNKKNEDVRVKCTSPSRICQQIRMLAELALDATKWSE